MADFIDNSEAVKKQIDEGIKRASAPVDMRDLFNDEFVARYTQFSNFKAMLTQAYVERIKTNSELRVEYDE